MWGGCFLSLDNVRAKSRTHDVILLITEQNEFKNNYKPEDQWS